MLDEMMQCPYSLKYLSEHGLQPDGHSIRGTHDDGCGMAFSNNGNIEIHKRSKENAWNESYLNTAHTASSNIIIGYNRLASKALDKTEEGSHPFIINAGDKSFALCHNRGIKTYMAEAIQQHTSDSFIFLQKLIDDRAKNDAESIFLRLKEISKKTAYSSLTSFLMTDKELFVWRAYNEQDEKAMDSEKHYTLYMAMKSNSAVFSSEPLDASLWMLIENKTFLHLCYSESKISPEYRNF